MMDSIQRRVCIAARALAHGGLFNTYGPCNMRIGDNISVVYATRPIGLIAAGEPGIVVSISGTLPEGVLGEVRVHQQIHQRRRDVNAVCRVLPPQGLALPAVGLIPTARHGFGFFPSICATLGQPRVAEKRRDASAAAETVSHGAAVVMRSHGP